MKGRGLTVEVARSLDVAVPKAEERGVRLVVAALGHEPARGLGAEEDLGHDHQRWDTRLHTSGLVEVEYHARRSTYGGEHEAPVEAPDTNGVRDVAKPEIDDITKHDPERRPRLEHHDEGPTDERWRTLRRVDGDRRALGAKSESEEESRHEEMRPGVGDALPYASDEGEYAGNEDRASAAK